MKTLPVLAKPTFDYGEILLKASELSEDLKAEVPQNEAIRERDEIEFNVTIGGKELWSATVIVTSETIFPQPFLIPKEVFLELIKPASTELRYTIWNSGGGNPEHSPSQKVVVV